MFYFSKEEGKVASSILPVQNFAQYEHYTIFGFPGVYVFQSINYPEQELQFDNTTLPQRFASGGQAEWNGIIVNFGLCDWVTSFGAPNNNLPSDQQIDIYLQTLFIPGPGQSMGTLTAVLPAAGLGVSIVDTVDSTPTTAYIKNLIAGTNVTITSTNTNATINSSGVIETFSNSVDPGEGLKDTTNSTATDIFIKRLETANSMLTINNNTTNLELEVVDILGLVPSTTFPGSYFVSRISNEDSTSLIVCANPPDPTLQIVCGNNQILFDTLSDSATISSQLLINDVKFIRFPAIPGASFPAGGDSQLMYFNPTSFEITHGPFNLFWATNVPVVDGGVPPALLQGVNIPGDTLFAADTSLHFIAFGTAALPIVSELRLMINGSTRSSMASTIALTDWKVESYITYISGPPAAATLRAITTVTGPSLSRYFVSAPFVENLTAVMTIAVQHFSGLTVFTGIYTKAQFK